MRALRPLLLALTLSLFVHLLLLGHEAWQLPLAVPQEQALRPLTATLKKMQLTDAGTQQTSAAKTTAALAPRKPAPKASHSTTPDAKPDNKQAASAPTGQPLPALALDEPSAQKEPAKLASQADTIPPRLAETLAELDKLNASAPEASAPPAVKQEVPTGYMQPQNAITRFPDQATLYYHAYYGAAMVGGGQIIWQRSGASYRIEARIKGLFGPALRYLSEGRVSQKGLRPDSYQAFRNDTLREHARFDYDAQRLDYGDKEAKSTQLEKGAQDVLSLAFQLALNGADLGDMPTQITTGKKVYSYPLKAAGETDYDTDEGRMRVALVRASKDGDVNEYWLAPDFANLPVRILRADRDKSLELRAYQIDIDGSAIWKLPPRKMRKNEN